MDWDDEEMPTEEVGLVADRIWREILERGLPAEKLTRIRGLLDVVSRRVEPTLCPSQGKRGRWFMPDLNPATAWMDRAAFEPLASKLEALYPELRNEIRLAELGSFRPYGYTADDPADDVRPDWSPPGWDELRLWQDFKPTANVLRLPVAARAVQAIVDTTVLVNYVAFLAMDPGTHLPPHHDRANWYVSIHLGIVVPEQCALRVGDEERSWEEGKCLFFDNSFTHEAWNRGVERRIVFAAYVAHPLTTTVEREALRILQNRYHSLSSLGHEAAIAWARS